MNQQSTSAEKPELTGHSSVPPEITAEENRVTTYIHLGPEDLLFDIPEADLHRPDGYEIVKELGRGSTAIVYVAREIKLNRLVALKMLRSGRVSREDLARFRREAETIAQLTHPNIVRIHGVGEHCGIPFLSLEYCDGGNLDEFIRGCPQLERLSARIVETIARAVQAAHEQGIIHRDLKPSNILLTDGMVPKVSDFGVAKFADLGRQSTQIGIVFGTPCYIAPEQARGDRDLTDRVDVYSLGAILYELLTGRPPHNGPTPVETMRLVAEANPLPPSRLRPGIDRDLEVICLRCLEKLPALRYASALELAEDLWRYQRGEPIHARPIHHIERIYRWCRRNPRETFLRSMMVVFVVVSLVTLISNWSLRESRNSEFLQYQLTQFSRFDNAIVQYRKWREQALEASELPERSRLFELAQFSLDQAGRILNSAPIQDRESTYWSCRTEAREDGNNEELNRRLDAVRLEVSLAGLKEIALHADLPHGEHGVECYLRCLRDYSIDPSEEDTTGLTVRLRQKPESIRARIADALDHLAILAGPSLLRKQSLRLANDIDPTSASRPLRERLIENDVASLNERSADLPSLESDPRTVLLLGNFLIAAGSEEVGEEILARALERRPRDFWLSHDLAIQLLVGQKRDPIQAVRTMSVARALRADEHAVDFHLGLTLKLARRDVEAIRALKLLLESNPYLEEARDLVARAYGDLGKPRECIEWLQQSRAICPESLSLTYRLAITLREQGNLEEANKLFDRILQFKANKPEDVLFRASSLEYLGRRKESIELLEAACNQFPGHYRLTYQLALLYSRSRNEEKEKELFQRAAELDPMFPPMHRKVGLALMNEKQYAQAIPYLEAANRLEPGRLDTLSGLAKCLAAEGKPEAGRVLFREAHEQQPGDSKLILEYALFLRDVDRLDESRTLLVPLCAREPKNLGAHRGLSTVLQKSYRFDDAYQLLRELASRSEGDRPALDRVQPWLHEADLLRRRDSDWKRYSREKILPTDAWELLALAKFADQWRQEPTVAVDIFRAAFIRHSRFLQEPTGQNRIDAARVAMHAARDFDSPNETRSQCRDAAREWMSIEAGLIEQRVTSGLLHEVTAAKQRAANLLDDPDFIEVRDGQDDELLPEEELLAWRPIWDSLRRSSR